MEESELAELTRLLSSLSELSKKLEENKETVEVAIKVMPKLLAFLDILSNLSEEEMEKLIRNFEVVVRVATKIDDRTLYLLENVVDALRHAKTEEVKFFGIIRTLQDKDVRKSLGFLLNFAKIFGKVLDE
ncbi:MULTISPECIES: DUF1641 domain-containing protein [unclassified Archaeoglobus]|jgi:uncharacterized protein YjgD (DUF1641 family)|uniref:DUF1641 domain-containing protein n=1 Tax=unclassified Archaeoglobus TaxID=2643606 RepID=UPI0025BC4A64|nr:MULTISPECIES: DUF1641 domain-containing protein [unclassified Archaeoglobus]